MPLPKNIFSVTAFLCEKVLIEEDKVNTAIRIVDAFYFHVTEEVPLDLQGVQMSLLVICKAASMEETNHQLELFITRPNGEKKLAGPAIPMKLTSRIPDVLGGFNLHASIGVVPRQFGVHYFTIVIDGEEVDIVRFMLLESPKT